MAGRQVAEATMLACTDALGTRANSISVKLIRRGLLWSLASGIDDWCVVVNPKHVKFWHQTLGLEILGESRPCGHVLGHPGILLRLPLREIRSGEIRPCPLLELPEPGEFPSEPEEGYELTAEEIAALLVRRPEILRKLTLSQWALLRQYCPGALWLAEQRILADEAAIAA